MINKIVKNLFGFIMLLTIATLIGCVGDDFEGTDFPDTAFDNKGAIAVISNVQGGFFNLLDKENTTVSFDLEGKGETVSSIDVFKSYNGGDAVMHANVSPGPVSVTLQEAIDGLGVSLDDVAVGDVVQLSFETNTSTGTFKSGETLDIPASCPSSLAGDYTSTTSGTSTDGCCPGTFTAERDITLTEVSGGVYTVSDFSAGLYFDWYEVYGITAANETDGALNAQLTDICGDITGTGTEPFGTAIAITGSVDASTGVITYTWTNGFDDTGSVVMTPK